MSDPKQIKVQGVYVTVSQPYAEGHTISEAEARALNQVRAENIGNNVRAAIKDLVEAAGGDTEKVAAEAQALVSEKDASYVFTLASVGGGGTSRLDPLTKECRAIAKTFIIGKIKEAGMSQKDYVEKNGENAIKDKIIELADHPEIVKAAKKALAEREKMAGIGSEISL